MTQATVFLPIFPGTNCDRETRQWLTSNLEIEVTSQLTDDLHRVSAAVIPGGFSYGDYLRAGAIAAESKAIGALKKLRNLKTPILGICNGFQILCESHILPGALLRNSCHHHLHGPAQLDLNLSSSEAVSSAWLPQSVQPHELSRILHSTRVPISCGMGSYLFPREVRDTFSTEISLHTTSVPGRRFQSLPSVNPVTLSPELHHMCLKHDCVPLIHYTCNEPGSQLATAAISTRDGRVLGMMPHPERAADALLGGEAGLLFLWGLSESQNLKIKEGSRLESFVNRIRRARG